MSLIFDSFPSIESAEAFIVDVQERFRLDGQLFATDAEAYEDDARPWTCCPPIVHIDRFDIDYDDERDIDDGLEIEQRV